MASVSYKISYAEELGASFSSRLAAKKYLEAEQETWEQFLEFVASRNDLAFQRPSGSLGFQALAVSFDVLLEALGDETRFNRLTSGPQSSVVLPPPSDSLEGQLILGLQAAGEMQHALAVYTWFVATKIGARGSQKGGLSTLVERGLQLRTAAAASSVLPFNQVSSQKITGAVRKAKDQIEALNAEVTRADEINTEHQAALSSIRARSSETARRVLKIISKRERKRQQRHNEWMADVDARVEQRFEDAEKRIKALDRAAARKAEERETEFERLQDLFRAQLRLRAPVELWAGRESAHKKAAQTAFKRFGVSVAVAIGIGVLVPYCAGNYIAESFFTKECNGLNPEDCQRMFSAKGPLTITGLLLVLSLILWVIRLQFRVFLSERHLSLDASEKKAFAETYLAMKEGEDVGADNEAIVLAALFRPTQDGIIKDDESGVDLSAAAILAKQLGRNT